MSETRDGPFDLTTLEIVDQLGRVGLNISRRDAAYIATWAYQKFKAWRYDSLAMTPSEPCPPQPNPIKQEKSDE